MSPPTNMKSGSVNLREFVLVRMVFVVVVVVLVELEVVVVVMVVVVVVMVVAMCRACCLTSSRPNIELASSFRLAKYSAAATWPALTAKCKGCSFDLTDTVELTSAPRPAKYSARVTSPALAGSLREVLVYRDSMRFQIYSGSRLTRDVSFIFRYRVLLRQLWVWPRPRWASDHKLVHPRL